MPEILMGAALGYLLALALLGYVVLLQWIKNIGKHGGRRNRVPRTLVALHFAFGVGALLFVPALFIRHLKNLLPDVASVEIAFAAMTFAMIIVVFFVVKDFLKTNGER